MTDIVSQLKIFDAEKKAIEIYNNLLDRKIDASFYTDCRIEEEENKKTDLVELQLKLLKMIKKSSEGYKNEIKQYCSSEKILKDSSTQKRLDTLTNILNNRRLNYLDSKESLNNYEKKKYLNELRNLRNKLYNFNNSYLTSVGRKKYSFTQWS